jgi:Cd2+/Zn2+-exporting ATPase
VVLAAATTLGLARIGPAVVFHEGSTLVVIFNSLRLLAYRRDLDAGPAGVDSKGKTEMP